MAGTFAALVTAPLELLFQVGAAVALGVLLMPTSSAASSCRL